MGLRDSTGQLPCPKILVSGYGWTCIFWTYWSFNVHDSYLYQLYPFIDCIQIIDPEQVNPQNPMFTVGSSPGDVVLLFVEGPIDCTYSCPCWEWVFPLIKYEMFECAHYAFSHNYGFCVKWLHLKDNYYWRDPCFTSMIMGGRVFVIDVLSRTFLLLDQVGTHFQFWKDC